MTGWPSQSIVIVPLEAAPGALRVRAVVWAALVTYELITPEEPRPQLVVVGNIIWILFIVEFIAKLKIPQTRELRASEARASDDRPGRVVPGS